MSRGLHTWEEAYPFLKNVLVVWPYDMESSSTQSNTHHLTLPSSTATNKHTILGSLDLKPQKYKHLNKIMIWRPSTVFQDHYKNPNPKDSAKNSVQLITSVPCNNIVVWSQYNFSERKSGHSCSSGKKVSTRNENNTCESLEKKVESLRTFPLLLPGVFGKHWSPCPVLI